jgi:hypothetical protein
MTSAQQPSLFFADRFSGEASCFAVFPFIRTLKSPLCGGLPNLLHTHWLPWPGSVRTLMLVSIVHTHKALRQVKNDLSEKYILIDHIRLRNGRMWLS